jgi:hypothetical protein
MYVIVACAFIGALKCNDGSAEDLGKRASNSCGVTFLDALVPCSGAPENSPLTH